MSFCNYSRELISSGYTLIETAFISDYMPEAPPKCAEVYLYGLFLCGAAPEDNTVSLMSRALSMDEEDVLTAFTYWEELGLVRIVNRKQFEIVYLPINTDTALLKKINPGKYAKFNKEIQNVLTGRLITPNEFSEYYLFLETTRFQPEALVKVADYCVQLKGGDINYPYILTVARNLSNSGVKTSEKVEEKLSGHDKYSADLGVVFKALNLKRSADFEDRRLYEKWTAGCGFTLDTIVYAAKQVKSGGVRKLDDKLDGYFRLKLLSQKEIAAYEKKRGEMYGLTVEINKIIGLYYSSLDYIVEDYVAPWLAKGFEDEALKLIAKYCFTHSIRTFEGLNQTVDKFYRLGLITSESITQYANSVVREDGNIKQILEECGLVRMVSSQDRAAYKTWTKSWGLDYELIKYAASLSASASNPMAYLNKILSEFKAGGISDVEQAKTRGVKFKTAENPFHNHPQHAYTAEQLNALFDDLDELSK